MVFLPIFQTDNSSNHHRSMFRCRLCLIFNFQLRNTHYWIKPFTELGYNSSFSMKNIHIIILNLKCTDLVSQYRNFRYWLWLTMSTRIRTFSWHNQLFDDVRVMHYCFVQCSAFPKAWHLPAVLAILKTWSSRRVHRVMFFVECRRIKCKTSWTRKYSSHSLKNDINF